MSLKLTAGLCLFLAGFLQAGERREAYEALAARVQIFSPEALMYGIPGVFLVGADSQSSGDLEAEFAALADRTNFAEFPGLLKHRDPKVRTLALAGVFRSENPQGLPLMADYAWDREQTFLQPGAVPQYGERPPPQEQTVGMVAWTLVDLYLKAASIRYQMTSVSGYPGFPEYWEVRKNRKACASWFAARLRSATGVGSPDPARIQRLRKEIDALLGDDGPVTLLWLQGVHGQYGGNTRPEKLLITPGELVGQLKKIGREKLWRILRGENLTDDPDLAIREGNENFQTMRRFVFDYAPELFLAEDAEKMIATGRENPDSQPDWWVAAARLQPMRAAKILHEGLEFFQDKRASDYTVVPLMVCLWELEGTKEAGFIMDWYYARNSVGKVLREKHWERLVGRGEGAAPRKLMRLLLEDERAANLQNDTLSEMASRVNRWARRPVITDEEIGTLRGGWGKGGLPMEPKDVPGVLDRLRKSIPEWAV